MRKFIYNLFTYLFPILMLDYYLIMRGINLNTFIVLPIFFFITVVAVKIGASKGRDSFILFINLFLGYSLLTATFYLFNDAPFSCYTTTLRQFVFPIIFAYLGCWFSNDHQFNKWYLYGCAFCFIVGFYLYFAAPPYYVRYLSEVRANAFNASTEINESNVLDYTRFSSFFTTSYAVSYFSVPALILSLSYSLKSENTIRKVVFYFITVVSFIAAILCQQRIAMGSSIVIVLFWAYYSRFLKGIKGSFGVLLTYALVLAFAVYTLGYITGLEWFERVSDMVSLRFEQMQFNEAMSIRTGQYATFDRMTDLSFFFGLGLGSCGHAAVAAGLKAIADGEFIKLFYELGVIGCSVLALVILPTLYRGIKLFKYYYAEVIIIVFYMASGIAADSLTFFFFSIMFWYSLGRIWNKAYFARLKKEQNNITTVP